MEDVVIIGSGWTGLAAAVNLRGQGIDPLVLERGSTPGGAAATWVKDDWRVEAGPHAFYPAAAPMQRLLDGLGGKMGALLTAPATADRFLLHRGHRVAVPRSPAGLVTTPLLSPTQKLRLLAEPFMPQRSKRDETVAAFAARRFGQGAQHIIDAMVTGIYAGDPERLGAALVFPRLVAAESEHGSVLKGVLRSKSPARGPLAAPRDGMGPWLTQVASRFRVSYDTPVLELEQTAAGWHVTTPNEVVEARRVLLAMPPPAAAELLDVPAPAVVRAPVASVGLGWSDAGSLKDTFDGYGILHPETEEAFSLGLLYESSLFAGRAPAGGVLVRALVGGRRHPERTQLRDDEIVARVLDDVRKTHGAVPGPDLTCVLRPPPIPQLEQGHVHAVAKLEQQVSRSDRLEVAGWGWRSVGITDCVAAGQDAAVRLTGGKDAIA